MMVRDDQRSVSRLLWVYCVIQVGFSGHCTHCITLLLYHLSIISSSHKVIYKHFGMVVVICLSGANSADSDKLRLW